MEIHNFGEQTEDYKSPKNLCGSTGHGYYDTLTPSILLAEIHSCTCRNRAVILYHFHL